VFAVVAPTLLLFVAAVCLTLAACGGPTDNTMVLPTPTASGTIAFGRVQDGKSDIWLVNADGSGLRQLTHNAGNTERPAWSPDGSRITYVIYPKGQGDPRSASLWIMNADGSNQRQLTTGEASDSGCWGSSWSPDGTKIAFTQCLQRDSWNTAVINPDGSGFKRLTETTGFDFASAWTPDGRILFVHGGSLFAINPDGSGRTEVTAAGGVHDCVFALSPDGKTLAVQTLGSPNHVALVPFPEGGAAAKLLDPLSDYIMQASSAAMSWAPDGKTLVVGSSSDRSSGHPRLFIVNPDGSGLSAVPGVVGALDPAWRPQ
jgi:Tol biopolymer transport system component